MITKAQLIKALEPFDDEIEIVFQDNTHKFLYSPRIFYGLESESARIIFANHKGDEKKWVELKV